MNTLLHPLHWICYISYSEVYEPPITLVVRVYQSCKISQRQYYHVTVNIPFVKYQGQGLLRLLFFINNNISLSSCNVYTTAMKKTVLIEPSCPLTSRMSSLYATAKRGAGRQKEGD